MTRPVLVAGATGFVGHHVVQRLLAAGTPVVGGSRNPARARRDTPLRDGIEWVRFDVGDPTTHAAALDGKRALVYLVHLMRADCEDLVSREEESARNVARAASEAGLERIVYLGGPAPAGGVTPSHHLHARLVTGSVLRAGTVPTIELQAAMIIGAESQSWRIVRDLALRLPVMVLPSWLDRVSEPIGIDDAVDAIVGSLNPAIEAPARLGLPGPEAVSGTRILKRVAAHADIRAVMVPVPLLTPELSSHWIRLVSRADFTVARQLVDGLQDDLLASRPTWWEVSGTTPTPLDEAIRRALTAEPPSSLPRWQRAWERVVSRVSLSPRRRSRDR
ncbi:MAG: NAD(P)H-binding protein [Myxococcota bacterium]